MPTQTFKVYVLNNGVRLKKQQVKEALATEVLISYHLFFTKLKYIEKAAITNRSLLFTPTNLRISKPSYVKDFSNTFN